MPFNESVLHALASASKFSTSQLNGISNSVLGTALTSISSESTPERQAQDMIEYARQYDLLRELAAAFLYTGADKPGLQNLLLGEDMEQASSKQQDSTTYIMLRIENKVDNISLRLDNFEQRMRTVEAAQFAAAQSSNPVSASDRAVFVMFAVILIAMLAYNIIGRLP